MSLRAHTILVFFRTKYYVIASGKRGPQKILSYFWGKGVCERKTGDCRVRRLTGQKRSIRRGEKGANKQKTNKQIKCVCLVKSAVYDACAYKSSASCVGVSSGSYVSKVISAGKQPYIPSGSYIFGANAAWLISFLLFNDFINPPPFILCKTENSIRLEKDNSRLL